MGLLGDIWARAKETPDERRQRQREGRKQKHHAPPPTSHPDDHTSFEGMDRWWDDRKGKGRH